jgi:NAD(P)-dependent dehydrogenase (short-subunit alcohol dehydrogenase family)
VRRTNPGPGAIAGRHVLVTGATGGVGPSVCRALAREGATLALSALPDRELDAVVADVRGAARGGEFEAGEGGKRGRVEGFPIDLRDRAAPSELVARVTERIGAVDVLVHSAGMERVGRFETQTVADIEDVVRVNLVTALHLARLLLPGMRDRGWGRLVFVSSLTGKTGPAYTGAYAASKAGLGALARTIRAEYRGTGVTTAVVVPGFVRDHGMYARARTAAGFRPAWALGTVRREAVARAVVRALTQGLPEVLVQPGPTRLVLALGELFPGLVGQRLSAWAGADRLFREWAEQREASGVGE